MIQALLIILAEGKDAGFKAFAPFTKVHGYSGDDTIVLT